MSKIKNSFISNLKLIANSNIYSKNVQNAIDNGFIDNAIKIGDITYLTFAFEKTGNLYWPNMFNKMYFIEPKQMKYTIYGALAIDSKEYILKGYIRMYHAYNNDNIELRPQMINKNDKIKFNKIFTSIGFNLFPAITWEKSNDYVCYLHSTPYIETYEFDELPIISILNNDHSITIDYVEETLHIAELNKKLATYVSIGNKISNSINNVGDSIVKHAEIMKESIENISCSPNITVENTISPKEIELEEHWM